MRTLSTFVYRLGGILGVICLVAGIFLAPAVARADMKTGIEAYRAGDYETARREFSTLAETGNPNAQFNLAVLYLSGRGVERDLAKAIDLHRKAAGQGLVSAEHGMGVFYYQGMGVKQDYAEALKWFRRAASQGFAESEFNLAAMYFNRQGVQRDDIEIVKWVSLAAARKFAPAQYRLGQMYELGVIFAQNRESALHWYRQAEANGDEKAAAARARIAKSLNDPAKPPPEEPAAAATENAEPAAPPLKPSAAPPPVAPETGTTATPAPVPVPPATPATVAVPLPPSPPPSTPVPAPVSPPKPVPPPAAGRRRLEKPVQPVTGSRSVRTAGRDGAVRPLAPGICRGSMVFRVHGCDEVPLHNCQRDGMNVPVSGTYGKMRLS